jgi:uncharacterized protein YbaR (Trm112 family)
MPHLLSPDLLSILVCPETHQTIQEADPALEAKIIELQKASKLTNIQGGAHEGEIQGVLVREDGKIAYPIIDGIPVMLIDEAISLENLA